MFRYFNRKKGQSTLEYAVLIMIIIAALLTIQNYVKRGIQGRIKSSSDDIGDQYSVGNTNSIKTTVVRSVTNELFGGSVGQGVSVSRIIGTEITNTTENSTIVNSDQEYWGK